MASNTSFTADFLNREEVERLTPLLIYLAVIVLEGIPGNILVFLVYRKNAARSNFRFFITWLSVMDCLTCCIVGLVIFNIVHQYTFHGNLLCKFIMFLTCWPTFISVGTLCVIGIDRYRKVCKPHGRQISYNMAKAICAFLVVLAALFSWPTLVLFGLRDIDIHPYKVTGTTCAVSSEFDNSIYLKVFNGLLWMLFVTALMIIVSLYIPIGKRIFQHARKNKRMRSMKSKQNNIIEASSDTIVSNERSEETSPSWEKKDISEASVGTISTDGHTVNSILANAEMNIQPVPKPNSCVNTGVSKASNLQSRKESKAKQSAFVMFLISLMFIISFLPYLILQLVEVLNTDLIYTMSNEARVVYKFFLRSYLINSAVNPFIYCICTKEFGKEVKTMFVKLFTCSRH